MRREVLGKAPNILVKVIVRKKIFKYCDPIEVKSFQLFSVK